MPDRIGSKAKGGGGRRSTRAAKPGRPVRQPGAMPTKERIFAAAIDLFAEKGFAETSMREIAREVGVTEAAVYRHYASKDSILNAIFAYMEREIYSPLPPSPTPGVSVFRDMLETLPDFLLANPRIVKVARIMMNEMHSIRKIGEYMRRTYGARSDSLVEAIFKAQVDSGRIRSCDPRALALIFNAFRIGWLIASFIFPESAHEDARRIRGEMQDVIALFEEVFSNPDMKEKAR